MILQILNVTKLFAKFPFNNFCPKKCCLRKPPYRPDTKLELSGITCSITFSILFVNSKKQHRIKSVPILVGPVNNCHSEDSRAAGS